ncbi:MAG: amino acid transporter, partial [Terriglobales bacterium]
SLFTLTIFAEWLFYALAVTALFRFRGRGERSPFRMVGYPVLPALFVIIAVVILEQTFAAHLLQSGIGLAIILAGIPFFLWWRRRHRPAAPAA